MFSTTDTIVAIATPPGRGGIGVVRISGPEVSRIAEALVTHEGPLVPRHATLTFVTSAHGAHPIDQAIVTFFPSPASYTGDDVLEISAHGSPVILQTIVGAAMAAGARLAEPGEFTLRAYVNGRIDLPQAEAVADLIEAATPLQARAAFDQLQGTVTRVIAGIDLTLFDLIARLEASIDFPEEGYHFIQPGELAAAIGVIADRLEALLVDAGRGRLLREGFQVAILGRPNAGKSSLFNALVGAPRAIVTDVPGTTRDLVAETVDLYGHQVTFVDTAGLREGRDVVEREGIARSRGAEAVADVRVFVFDRSCPLDADEIGRIETAGKGIVAVANKSDLAAAWTRPGMVEVSAQTGAGLDVLRQRIIGALDVPHAADRPAITNVRHVELARQAREACGRARDAAASGSSEEFVLADLQDARGALEAVTGRRTADDVLAHIFARFCVGK